MTSMSDEKVHLSIVSSVDGTGGSSTGPDLENSLGDLEIVSSGKPVSFGLKVPGELEHCRARKMTPS
jgi:hypothetical protein